MPQSDTECDRIHRHTRIAHAPLLPSIRLHLITPECAEYWQPEGQPTPSLPWPLPYWAFAWPGGQVLAAYLLAHPELVRGRRVISIGSGCALEALVAAHVGAGTVTSNDIDPVALTAAAMNAELNHLTLECDCHDRVGEALSHDVILAGDVWYSAELAERMVPWLRRCARSALVLVGDAQRVPLPADIADIVWSARAPFDGDKDSTWWPCRVLRLKPD